MPTLAAVATFATVATCATVNVDVVVIGGGFAGLSAARLLRKHDLSVVVLEARGRAGGRVHSHRLDSGHVIDLGAQFIGDAQKHISSLVDEAGLTRVAPNTKGNQLFFATPKATPASKPHGTIPISLLGQLDAAQMIWRMDRAATKRDKSKQRAKLDVQPATEYLQSLAFSRGARDLVTDFVSREMCIPATEVSTYELLDQSSSVGGMSGEEGSMQWFLHEGADALLPVLLDNVGHDALRLNEPVQAVTQDARGVAVRTSTGSEFRGKKVVVAIPPQLYAAAGILEQLPEERQRAIKGFRIGAAIKTTLVFEKPWWRDAGLSGAVSCSTGGDFQDILDASPADGSAGILVAFSTAESARLLQQSTRSGGASEEEEEEERIARALQWLERAHRRQIPPLLAARSVDWGAEKWSLGGYASRRGVGGWELGSGLFAPFGNLHFAGTETADEWRSFMDGALQSGARAAADVVRELDQSTKK